MKKHLVINANDILIADSIINYVVLTHPVVRADLFSKRKTTPIANARAEAMFQIRSQLKWSYPKIGKFFDKDHSTCLYAIKRHMKRINP